MKPTRRQLHCMRSIKLRLQCSNRSITTRSAAHRARAAVRTAARALVTLALPELGLAEMACLHAWELAPASPAAILESVAARDPASRDSPGVFGLPSKIDDVSSFDAGREPRYDE